MPLPAAVAVKAYLRLMRLQTSGVTAVAPILGYLGAKHDFFRVGGGSLVAAPELQNILLLILLGVCAHVFGFVHNEIADREADAKAAYRRPKPLPSGDVSLRGAWALALAALAGGLAVALVLGAMTHLWPLFLAVASVGFAVLYNTKGKAVVGGDAFLGVSIFFLVMIGAAVVLGPEWIASPSALGFALMSGIIVFFNNAFEGGFKDHATDKEAGKRTLVLALRARGEKLDSPDGLLLFAQIPVHAAMLVTAVWMVLGPMAAADPLMNYVLVGLFVALTAGMIRTYNRGVALPDRKRALSMFARHEGFALLLLELPLFFAVPPLWWAAMFIVPFLVFVATNRVVHGTLFAPDV